MRVAIVNDMQLTREALRRVVESQPGYQVAWMAENGEVAVRLARQDRPDVILMDLVMPVLNGVDAIQQIMRANPCPILVVTATVSGNYPLVLQAMGQGAVDAVQTPQIGMDGKVSGQEDLLHRLLRLERSAKYRGPDGQSSLLKPPDSVNIDNPLPPMVAIGASTGGPEAVARILGAMPPDIGVPFVVIQHISSEFGSNFVHWLRTRTKLTVEAARENDQPRPGVVHVAVTDDHLVLGPNRYFKYTPDPVDDPFRPSVNACFSSLCTRYRVPGVAVLLTGMGADGAKGLGQLRKAGWFTIAQDESTSVVYGMPKAAAETNAACRIMPIGQIAGAILTHLASAKKSPA
ncbi:MAG: chemotaxis-specific protein-glutamate methyltransferase CheB [Gemmataceae bacterium]